MLRKIIRIDEERCDGCGLCAKACHEGAIQMVEGKARLIRDDYCDGLGDCLPACPTGAISFTEREAAAYDAAAVEAAMAARKAAEAGCSCSEAPAAPQPSQLRQWPVQLKLAPTAAPFYQGADLLIAADCSAYAYANFHQDFIRGRVTLIGCPKLDNVDYSKKLGEILSGNDVRSILLVRMEVPCCGGLEFALKRAMEASGKDIPLEVVTLSTKGEIIQ